MYPLKVPKIPNVATPSHFSVIFDGFRSRAWHVGVLGVKMTKMPLIRFFFFFLKKKKKKKKNWGGRSHPIGHLGVAGHPHLGPWGWPNHPHGPEWGWRATPIRPPPRAKMGWPSHPKPIWGWFRPPPFWPLGVAEPPPWAMGVARHPHSGPWGWFGHPLGPKWGWPATPK
jgi:hypothetical protein